MNLVFRICWLADVVLLFSFLSALIKQYASGAMANKSKKDAFNFLSTVSGIAAVVIAAIIFYSGQWLATATAVACIPMAVLLVIVLVPIIAYICGGKMN